MSTSFRVLFTVRISHAYYSGACRDFAFTFPPETAQLLRDGRLCIRERDGALSVISGGNEHGVPAVPLGGSRLRIGLKLVNPRFGNFTDPENGLISSLRIYGNTGDPASLDPPEQATLVGNRFTHVLSGTDRPVAVLLRDPSGTIWKMVPVESEAADSVGFDMTGYPAGTYIVEEIFAGGAERTRYYIDAELWSSGIAALIDVTIDDMFYEHPPEFVIDFAARKDLLKYYVIAKNYSEADLGLLSVADAGYAEEGRPEVTFSAVLPGDFTASELPLSLLEHDDAGIILFRSDTSVTRRERGRRKIQLSRNGDVLITHLPQPGADRADADMIIHISKP